jgi:predicted nuclease with RNAse H fold
MLTVGVDLAAEPKGTAVARVEWGAGRAVVRQVTCPADDEVILAALGEADKVGIDCPLGWPDDFVAFVRDHQRGAVTVQDAFDAVIAALTARAAAPGDLTLRPRTPDEAAAAITEGWVAVPLRGTRLGQLVE